MLLPPRRARALRRWARVFFDVMRTPRPLVTMVLVNSWHLLNKSKTLYLNKDSMDNTCGIMQDDRTAK